MNAPAPGAAAAGDLRSALFSPARVALVGASADPIKAASRPLAFLRAAGRAVDISLVNRRGGEIDGLPVHRSLRELPEAPDHVLIMTPTSSVLEVVADCAAVGAKVATILSGGFAEDGEEGARLQRRVLECAQAGHVRLLGPNSLGLVNLHQSLRLTANAVFADTSFAAGGTFVASQSGSLIGALVSRGAAKGVGFSTVVSVGAEADLSTGEICSLTLDDDAVTGYALFLETIRHADALAEFAVEAAKRSKPIAAYKLGRSQLGAQMALSHTGALAGDDDVADAFFEAHGIARLHTLDGLLEAQQLMRHLPARPRTAPQQHVAVVATTGGGAAMLVDELSMRGVAVCEPTAQTHARLAERGVRAARAHIVDLTLSGTRYDHMKAALDVLLDAPEFDLVMAVVGSSARTRPDLAVAPILDSCGASRPLATFLVPEAPEAGRLLRQAGIPTFTSPETAADVVCAATSRRAPRASLAVRCLEANRARLLSEPDSYAVLGRRGITAAPHVCVDIDQLDAGPGPSVDYPVAVKMLAERVGHKSDLGGVVLDVRNAAELRAAAQTIRERARRGGRVVRRVLVQSMVAGLAEFLVGYRVDAQVGPLIVLAAGGTNAELYRDRSVRLAPVDAQTAAAMVDEVVASRVLDGFRGAPHGDRQALAAAVLRLAGLASDDRILEAEVNPLVVHEAGRGATAVDAVVTMRADAPMKPD